MIKKGLMGSSSRSPFDNNEWPGKDKKTSEVKRLAVKV